MNSKYTKFLFLGFILVILHSLTSSYSNTAIGVMANNSQVGCTCHGVANINTVITVNGLPTGYGPGQTYPITVYVQNVTQVAAGINLSVSIGTINTLGAGLTAVSATAIRHSAPMMMSAGIATFTFNWTAPLTGTAPLNLYASANAVNLNGNNTGDFWNSYLSSTPLTLNSLEFTVQAKANAVDLNWKTENESEIKYFVIERSMDGLIFDSLNKVIANGSATGGRTYDYSDKPAYSNDYYYRLKIMDANGGFSYSLVKKAVFNNGAAFDFILFPNPAKKSNKIFINAFNNLENIISLNIYSRKGDLIYSRKEKAFKGTNYLQLIKDLPMGYYILELKPGNTLGVKKPFVIN
jgi:hypothetical protein